MNNKKWVFASLSTGVLIYLVSTIIYISVDAQSVFGKSITDKKFEYTQYYSIKQFDDLQSGQYSLIFGSSQMQKLSSRKLRKNILNLYNLHGSPNLILNFLSQLDEEKIKNVEHVYFNISVFSLLWEDEEAMINYKSNSYFDKLLYILPLSNAGMLATVRDIVNNIFENKFCDAPVPPTPLLPDGGKNLTSYLDGKAIPSSSLNGASNSFSTAAEPASIKLPKSIISSLLILQIHDCQIVS